MSFNGSDIVTDPIATIMKVFTDLLSSGVYLIPIGFIAGALWMKTKNMTTVSVWLFGSCIILGGSNLFTDYPQMSFLYFIFATIGLVGTVLSVWLLKN